MLPLTEIAALRTTVDDEWRSPVADAVGRAWDIPAGGLRYWRSSAAHVFVVPPGGDARGVLYARFAPAGSASGARLQRGSQLHDRLHDAGAPVAELVRSRAGRAVELVQTPLGEMAACVVRRVNGEELDVDGLDAGAAAAWGAALAEFHQAAGRVQPGRQEQADVFDRLVSHSDQDLADQHLADQELADAAQALNRLDKRLEPGPLVMGHGDFELDNLRWSQGKATCFDLDESGVMPAAADVASAVRDLIGTCPGSPERPELLEAFLAGYGRESGLTVDMGELLLHRAALAAQRILEAATVLDADASLLEAIGNGWLKELNGSLAGYYANQRDIVLAAARVLA
ncbi:phosphotransferase [Pseudarthrobacter oxydans]|uniref:phosphotransferase enzyme family protein n=1 Tax=Pseudarthrobacter oxydans TaxID=1671 RepID=UPI003D2B5343